MLCTDEVERRPSPLVGQAFSSEYGELEQSCDLQQKEPDSSDPNHLQVESRTLSVRVT